MISSFGPFILAASFQVAMPAPLIAHDLLWDVRRFVGLAPQADDLTIVVVKVL